MYLFDPTTFLYATLRRFLSSFVRASPESARAFMHCRKGGEGGRGRGGRGRGEGEGKGREKRGGEGEGREERGKRGRVKEGREGE